MPRDCCGILLPTVSEWTPSRGRTEVFPIETGADLTWLGGRHTV
jgi:hypothetical protein